MIIEKESTIHWNYFLTIESDVEHLSKYVEFTESNYSTHSIEMVRLLLSASSEIDIIAKLLCTREAPNKKAKNIDDYRKILGSKLPDICTLKVLIPRFGLELTPWENWQQNKSPHWWNSYNNVKHERDKHFEDANLKNTLNSIGGLFVFLLYFYRNESSKCKPVPVSTMFKLEDNYIVYSHDESIQYRLPLKSK
jgi:hypothetical protein